MSLLTIKNLSVNFHTVRGKVKVIRGINLEMGKEKVGIVGESGSGKSMTARAILGLIRPPGTVMADALQFDGIDLKGLNKKKRRKLRGRRMAMVMQDPRFSLNPVMSIGSQIAEAFRIHHAASRQMAKEKTLEMLEAVQIREPEKVYHHFPHEVSGGMGQRIMIAMMLIPEPDLLIADEPTSALDVTVQLQVLKILDDMVTKRGMGLIFISHDLQLVASFCDRVIVMYGGQIMEECEASQLHKARHPYTQGLLSCLPEIDRQKEFLHILSRQESWLHRQV